MAIVKRDDGAQIWWESHGPEGTQPVVLVTGLGYPAAMWWRQLPALTSAHRVILIDNRGAGRTGDVVGAPYTIEMMAADVIAVIDATGEHRVHLAGLSMGGMIAQEVALTRPDLVQSLVLMSTHPGVRHATFEPAALNMLRRRGNLTAREAAELAIPFNYATATPRTAIEEDWAVRLPLAATPAGYLAQMRGGAAWSSLARLATLEPPALVLHGADDKLVPPVNGERVATAIPGAVHIRIDNANHILTTDKTNEVNGLLLAWFEKFLVTGGVVTAAEDELAAFRETARAWLRANATPRSHPVAGDDRRSDSVAVFHDLPFADEQALVERVSDWQRRKYDAGFGALSWAVEDGGAGLTTSHEVVFAQEERHFRVPAPHELASVTLHLVAPTLRRFGTEEVRTKYLTPFLRGDAQCCQLFSEPSAGSDLAGLGTRATRDGDAWVVNGQKVWSSGAQFADFGELIARSDPSVPKHAGLTAFLLPLDLPGIEVRPLRQMSGGRSFCEVFLTDVRVPDTLRLGAVGEGWKVALTTLGFERGHSGTTQTIGGGWRELLPLARELGRDRDPLVRRRLADVWISEKVLQLSAQRDHEAQLAGQDPGPISSLRKLHWVDGLTLASEAAAAILGPRLAADTGEWGTFAWTEHLLGAPGYRIAGGSDEIQRNIVGERLLGLPAEPRADTGPWRDVPR